VLAVPSGQPLGNALVECSLFWSGLPLVSAHTNDAGTAYLSMRTGQLELGRPVMIRVTDAWGRRAFSGAVLLDSSLLLTVRDLATIDVAQDQPASLDYESIVLYSDPPAGVSIPQFLDRCHTVDFRRF